MSEQKPSTRTAPPEAATHDASKSSATARCLSGSSATSLSHDSSKSSAATRLNKFIAERTGLSRREVDERIAAGRVKIDGKIATLGARIEMPEKNRVEASASRKSAASLAKSLPIVTLDGKLVSFSNNYTYLLLNKPAGYVCSKKRQGSAPTVYELLPKKYRALKTVGRLDRDSSGLILLTNDGDFSYRMTHPRFKKTKIYEVALDHSLTLADEKKITSGVELADGLSRLGLESITPTAVKPSRSIKPNTTTFSRPSGKNCIKPSGAILPNATTKNPQSLTKPEQRTHFRVTITEGRNRQIRRTFAALGYEVVKLHRTNFGPYAIDNLSPSEFRVIMNS